MHFHFSSESGVIPRYAAGSFRRRGARSGTYCRWFRIVGVVYGVHINRNRYLQIYTQLSAFCVRLMQRPDFYDVAVEGDDVGGRKYDGAKPEFEAAPKYGGVGLPEIPPDRYGS